MGQYTILFSPNWTWFLSWALILLLKKQMKPCQFQIDSFQGVIFLISNIEVIKFTISYSFEVDAKVWGS